MGSFYKQQLNDWVGSLDVKANFVLDIGGAQSPIKGRTKTWDVQHYYIIDLETPHVSKQMPDYTQDMNYDLTYEMLFKHGGDIDLIFMLGVMDYVINPNIAMANIYDLLTRGGVAWVEFPFLYAHHNPIDEEGCRYSHGCIKRLCKQANLEIVEWIWKRPHPNNPYLQMFYQADGMRAARGFDHNVTGFITKLKKA